MTGVERARLRTLDGEGSGASVRSDEDKKDLRENMLASVDKTTGKSDGQISYDARIQQMSDDRVAGVADDQRRRGVQARARLATPDVEPAKPSNDKPTLALADLDPYKRA